MRYYVFRDGSFTFDFDNAEILKHKDEFVFLNKVGKTNSRALLNDKEYMEYPAEFRTDVRERKLLAAHSRKVRHARGEAVDNEAEMSLCTSYNAPASASADSDSTEHKEFQDRTTFFNFVM